MTASHNPPYHPLGVFPVGARVRVHRADGDHRGRINAVHRRGATTEYVIHLDAADGGLGQVINVRVGGGRASALAPAVRTDGDLR
jgi:hypothetical protein